MEKANERKRPPRRWRSKLLGGVAVGATAALLGCSASSGFSANDGSFDINCGSGNKQYVFYDNNPGNTAFHSLTLGESDATSTTTIDIQSGKYSTNSNSNKYTAYTAGEHITDVTGAAEVMAGEMTGTGTDRKWANAATAVTFVCYKQIADAGGDPLKIPADYFTRVAWETI